MDEKQRKIVDQALNDLARSAASIRDALAKRGFTRAEAVSVASRWYLQTMSRAVEGHRESGDAVADILRAMNVKGNS